MPVARCWPAATRWSPRWSAWRRTTARAPCPKQVAAFGISGGDGGGLKRLLMSHPPLDERIAALRSLQIDGSAMRQGVVA